MRYHCIDTNIIPHCNARFEFGRSVHVSAMQFYSFRAILILAFEHNH